MKIEYLGHSCFLFTAENGKKVLTDPYTKVGYELPSGISADIILVSHGHFDHSATDKVQGGEIIALPGKFCVQGIEIVGMETWHDPQKGRLRGKNTVYTFTMDGITVCHLGDLGEEYSEKTVEKIGKTDILLVPVGGTYTIDGMQAKLYAEKIAPKMIIPMHYRPTDGALDITDAQPFLRLYQVEEITCIASGMYEIDKNGLQNSPKILYIERKGK